MEKPRPDGLTNKQRAKREAEAQKQKATRFKKRVGVAVGTAIASVAVIGGAYIAQRGGDSEPLPIPSGSLEDVGRFYSLRELTKEHVDGIAVTVSNDYTRLTGVEVNSSTVLNVLSLAPNLDKMTPEEKLKFCGTQQVPLPCTEIAGIKTRNEEIFVYKDRFDLKLQGSSDTKHNQKLRDDVVYQTLAHEISHWITPAFPLSNELAILVQKHLGDEFPEIRDPELFRKEVTRGGFINFRRVDDSYSVEAFRGIEEAEAELIARFILQNNGKEVLLNVKELDTPERVVQLELMENLLKNVNSDYASGIRFLANSRVTDGGREELLRRAGKHFGASDENALELGFQIYEAIDKSDVVAYKNLTK